MVKIILILLSFGLSTLTTLLIGFDKAYLTVFSIIGLGFAYIFVAIIIFFLIAFLISLPIKKGEMSQHYNNKFRMIYINYVKFALSLFSIKVVVNGLDKLPKDSNFVVVQNHRSNLDPMIFDVVMQKYPLIFIGKESLFNIPFWGKIISKAGYVKLKRVPCLEDGKELLRGFKMVQENECSIVVYPEGTRNKTYPNPKLLEFKEGAFSIATKLNKPIVITVVHDSEKINKFLLLKIHRVQYDIVDVIYPEKHIDFDEKTLSFEIFNLMKNAVDNPLKIEEYKRLY